MFYSCSTRDYQQCFTFQTNHCQDFLSLGKLCASSAQLGAIPREGGTAIAACYPCSLTSVMNCTAFAGSFAFFFFFFPFLTFPKIYGKWSSLYESVLKQWSVRFYPKKELHIGAGWSISWIYMRMSIAMFRHPQLARLFLPDLRLHGALWWSLPFPKCHHSYEQKISQRDRMQQVLITKEREGPLHLQIIKSQLLNLTEVSGCNSE